MSDLRLTLIINAVTEGLRAGVSAAQSTINDFGAHAQRVHERMASNLSHLRTSFSDTFGTWRSALATLGMGAIARDILQTNREMESLRVQMVSVTGSAEKGAEAFNAMLQLATDTPFEIKDLTKSYVMLKNFGLEPTEKVMDALTNQVSKLGGSADTLSGVTLALGQAWGKGKLQAQDINQMVERGVPVYELLTQVTGKQSAQLLEMSEKGEITREVMEKLIAKMGEMASGSNARAMETLNGKISVLADSWHKFEDALLQDKSEGLIKRIVSNWGAWLDAFTDKLNDVGGQFAKLDQINVKIATQREKISTMENQGSVGSFLDDLTGQDVNLEKNRLAALHTQRQRLIQDIVDEKRAKKESADGDADKLATSKALAKTQTDLAEHSKTVAEWSEKYANNAQKMALELAKARKELGKDFTPELEKAIIDKYAPKKPKAPVESDRHGFEQGLTERKMAFEREHALREFSKKEEKAYWDGLIATYRGNSKTLADLQKKSADLDLRILRDAAKEKQALQKEAFDAEHATALDALNAKEAASQQELDLGAITQEQHLDNLRNFAAQRLAVEQKLLDDKRKLLGDDALALAQNLHEKEALERVSAAKIKALDNQEALAKKTHFKQLFAPFENALEQSVNGILTGQQTVKKAVANAAQSMVVSYVAAFVKKRVLMAAEWAWEAMGFSTLETAKTATKVASESAQVGAVIAGESVKAGAVIAGEAVQTSAVAAGESTRGGIVLLGTLMTIGAKAAQAAAGAFSWVMSEVPFPLNVILAPLAAAGAFAGTMAFAAFSAEGGEWQVGKDGSPYVLHQKESVLPAGVAENFRKVVGIVNAHVGSDDGLDKKNNHIAVIEHLFASGQLPKRLGLPGFALNLADQSQAAANALAHDRVKADQGRQAPTAKTGETTVHIHGIALAPEDFFKQHSKAIVKVAAGEARKFNAGKRR